MTHVWAWMLLFLNVPPWLYLIAIIVMNPVAKDTDIDWVLLQSVWSCWLNIVIAFLILLESHRPWIVQHKWFAILICILCVVTLLCQWMVSLTCNKDWILWFWFQVYIGLLNMLGWICYLALGFHKLVFYQPLEDEPE